MRRWASACARRSTRCRCARCTPAERAVQLALRSMDKLLISGGRPLARRGARIRREERRAADHVRGAAHRRAARAVQRAAAAGRQHHARAARADGRRGRARRRHDANSAPSKISDARRALRAGEDDARLDPGRSGPLLARCGGPRCRCRAAALSARVRSTSTSRACRRWARRSASSTATCTPRPSSGPRPARRARRHGLVTVTGTENLMMAATPGRGHDGASRTPRASPRSSTSPKCLMRDGRQDRGRRHRRSSASKAWAPCGGTAHAVMPDRIETGTYPRGRRGGRRPRAAQPGRA